MVESTALPPTAGIWHGLRFPDLRLPRSEGDRGGARGEGRRETEAGRAEKVVCAGWLLSPLLQR